MSEFAQRRAEAMAYHAASMKRVRDTPAPKGQRYAAGTRVRISDDLGPRMSHFPSGMEATVEHTYAHAYGGDDVLSYCLNVDGHGQVSWYYESQLTPV